nr:GNAT family N-acetyltransferase [Paenibacillus sp. RC67]
MCFHDEIIGGVAVQHKSETQYRISPMYLNPDYHNKGLGSQILNTLFSLYPQAQMWTLSTPKPNLRNGHFYEKFGFVSVGEHYVNERLTLTHYRRELN